MTVSAHLQLDKPQAKLRQRTFRRSVDHARLQLSARATARAAARRRDGRCRLRGDQGRGRGLRRRALTLRLWTSRMARVGTGEHEA